MAKTDSEYRNELDCPMTELAMTLSKLGVPDDAGRSDAQLIDIAERKLKLLYDLVLAAGLNKNILTSVMKDI